MTAGKRLENLEEDWDGRAGARQAAECLGKARDLLERYASLVPPSDDLPALILRIKVDLGRGATAALQVLLQRQDTAIWADVVCRAYYELAARLLWASRAGNGWERLQAYWAEGIRKQDQGTVAIPSFAKLAKDRLRAMKELLGRRDASGNPILPAPPVEQMLRDIDKDDVRDGLIAHDKRSAEYHYNVIYRSLSQTAHGNLPVITSQPPEANPGAVMAVGVYAAGMLARAILHTYSSRAAQASDVDALSAELQAILKAGSPTAGAGGEA